MSNVVNKVKDALSSDKTHEAPQGSHGPHGSKVANTADPRVDSDRDHRGNPATSTGTHTGAGVGTTGTHTGVGWTGTHTGVGSTGTHAGVGSTGVGSTTGYGSGAPQGTHGPHGSKAANTVDPRVDSDLDHRGAPGSTIGGTGSHGTHGTTGVGSTGIGSTGIGSAGTHGTHGTHGTTGVGSTGVGSTTGYGSGAPEGTHGPHSSRVANAADPRVDSDRDHRAHPGSTVGGTTGTTGTHTGTTGTHAGTHAGTHTGTHTGTHAGTHTGVGGVHSTGPAPNTAGPHKSDLLNKVDPRVDSDLDGSKTVGGNKTHAGAGAPTGGAGY